MPKRCLLRFRLSLAAGPRHPCHSGVFFSRCEVCTQQEISQAHAQKACASPYNPVHSTLNDFLAPAQLSLPPFHSRQSPSLGKNIP